VPWLASPGEDYLAFTDEADSERRIEATLDLMRGGEDG
jgi:hypothetical protein